MRDPDRLRDDVFREVDALREELVGATSRILQFESISGTPEGPERARHEVEMAACAEFLRELSGRMEFEWRQSPGTWYRVEWSAEDAAGGRAKKPPVIGVPVHIDVVPAGGVWAFPPFSGAMADGAVWGRGAVDMKGPLMACLFGLHALKRAGFRPPVTYRLIIGTREEITEWSDIDEYLVAEGAPDFGFTPDACFPVVIGEKGTLVFGLKAEWSANGAAAGKESGDSPPRAILEPVLLRGGTRGNVVPDVCEVAFRFAWSDRFEARERIYAALGRLESDDCEGSVEYQPEDGVEAEDGRLELRVVFRGKSAHGSMPERGHNAVLDALQFVNLLDPPAGGFREFTRFLYAAGADLSGGALNLASSHDVLGPTTVNLGVARIARDGGEAVLNVRPTLGLSVAEAERRIEEAARAFSPEVLREWQFKRIHTAFEPQCLDPAAAAPFLRGLQEGLEAVTGEKAGFCAIPYTTYAKAMPNCCAFGPILHSVGEEEMAHQPDERVTIEALVRNTKIFALALAYAGQNVVEERG